MTEQTISFESGLLRLEGTLCTAGSGRGGPAALLVTGSGPLDRDSNMKRQRLTVTADFARHLAHHGVTTLRYDKRGVGNSEGDYHAAGFHDNVTDATAALAALRRHAEPSTAFAIGHSEGALVATRLAALGLVDGAVLLAGSARSGRDILLHQATTAAESIPRPVRIVMRLLRTDVRKLQSKRLAQLDATTDDTVRIQLVKINAKWFREFMAYDPADDYPAIEAPLLAITGGKDLQVPPEDLAAIAQLAGGETETSAPADLTHILRRDPEEASLRAYRTLMKYPTDQGVLDMVSDWVLRTTSRVERRDQPVLT